MTQTAPGTARRTTAGAALLLAAALATAPAEAAGRQVQITIYNQDFALVKETRTLTLGEGAGTARFADVTSLLEPDSVILRDPRDAGGLRILEQDYEADPLSEAALLRDSEGRVLKFRTVNPTTGEVAIVTGRLVRAGYPGQGGGWRSARGQQPFGVAAEPMAPIVEIDGRVMFSLPGQPLFDPPGEDAILKPTLLWKVWSDRAGARDVEVSYLTGGLRWEATYNLVAPEEGDDFDLVGWVTLENESGAAFPDARVKLMAGDVSRVRPGGAPLTGRMMAMESKAPGPQVSEKAFDEYHLYTLAAPTTLRDRETKQVEFCRAAKVPARRLYVYDGAQMPAAGGWDAQQVRTLPSYGTDGNTKVVTMIEFRNDRASGLGLPLPRGTMKLYRTDADGRREFIGENAIDHTPADETVRLVLGNAFDLRGERRQTDFRVDNARHTATEAFEIAIRNHKKVAVEVRVVEHLDRWSTWKIADSSDPWEKTDARTIRFAAHVPPDGEKKITYRVNYSW